MTLLLDTHIFYRWRVEPRKLSRQHVRLLTQAERSNLAVAIAAISLWELAMLASEGRIRIQQPLEFWIEQMTSHPGIAILPLTPSIAAASAQLTGLHGDPADRMIVATAQCHNLKLLTADERILAWLGVRGV